MCLQQECDWGIPICPQRPAICWQQARSAGVSVMYGARHAIVGAANSISVIAAATNLTANLTGISLTIAGH
jgi:hypothetical protein